METSKLTKTLRLDYTVRFTTQAMRDRYLNKYWPERELNHEVPGEYNVCTGVIGVSVNTVDVYEDVTVCAIHLENRCVCPELEEVGL